MKNKSLQNRAFLDGILLSLPSSVAITALLYLFFPHNLKQISLFVSLIIPTLGIYRQLKYLENENFIYQEQVKTKIYKDYENRGFGVGFITFFLYLVNVFGTIFMFFFFMLLFGKSSSKFFATMSFGSMILGFLFVFGYLGSVVGVLIYSLNTLYKNYTGYIIKVVKLSEFEVLGSGSKKFRFEIQSMIYGDENSEENLKIINANVESKLPRLKKQLLEEAERSKSLKKQQEDYLLEIEKNFEKDESKKLKTNLKALKQ